jgi:hypothetical protein
MNVIEALADPALFGPWFNGPSWDGWRAVLKGAFAIPMTETEEAFFRTVADRDPPKTKVRELWVIAGRRAGKDSIVSFLVAYGAALFEQAHRLRPGERAVGLSLAVDRDQAKVLLEYVRAYFRMIPMLSELLVGRDHQTGFELANGVDIIAGVNSFRSVRGRPFLFAVLDEVAFWRDDRSANPDLETYAAILPGLATLLGMLIGISSPYRRSGLLWTKFRDHYGKDGDVLVVKATTLQLNPTIDPAIIERALEEDPAAARAEWLAEFRTDIESFIGPDVLDAIVVPGRHELPPAAGVKYVAFIDPAGGSGGDSFTLAIAHAEGDVAILDAVRETRPPFSPDAVIDAYAELLGTYRVRKVRGDRWGGEFPRERLRAKGIEYEISEQPKSEIYRDALPLLNSSRAELLDLPRLKAQLLGLERRTARGGRDSIDHAPGGHDDIANVVTGVLLMASGRHRPLAISDQLLARARLPGRHAGRIRALS